MRLRPSLGLLLGLLALPAARGQDVKPAVLPNGGVHRMEIFNGPTRTVHYFPSMKSSPGERQSWRDLERAENEQGYVDDLQALRRENVSGERQLEAARQAIQPLLYSWSFDRGYAAGYLGGTYAPTSYGYPYAYSYYAPYSYRAYGAENVSQSLENGIGPEGVIKSEIARVIARQATAEYTAAVDRQLSQALAAMPGDGKTGDVRPVVFERSGPPQMVTVSLKSGDKVEGRAVYEDADWIIVRTATEEERLRKSEVVRVSIKTEKK